IVLEQKRDERRVLHAAALEQLCVRRNVALLVHAQHEPFGFDPLGRRAQSASPAATTASTSACTSSLVVRHEQIAARWQKTPSSVAPVWKTCPSAATRAWISRFTDSTSIPSRTYLKQTMFVGAG